MRVRRNIKTLRPSASGTRGTDMTLGNQSRDGAPVLWITIHTSQGFLGRPNDLYHYFDTVRTGSSHACADDNGIYEWIPYDRAAWTLRNGNNYSDNLEMLAMAEWTREQWLQHPNMIRNAARWAANRCIARNITPRRLSDAQVAGRATKGIIDHATYTRATHDGTHWDVGLGFPWDVFMSHVFEFTNPIKPPDNGKDWFDMASQADLENAVRSVLRLPPTGLAVPHGQTDNGNLAVNLTGLAQTEHNTLGAIQAAIAAVKEDTAVVGDNEDEILKALHYAAEHMQSIQ